MARERRPHDARRSSGQSDVNRAILATADLSLDHDCAADQPCVTLLVGKAQFVRRPPIPTAPEMILL